MSAVINHASVYANEPKRAARLLAALTGGTVESFHPLRGAWVCLFDGTWEGPLIEFYPRSVTLAQNEGTVAFRNLDPRASGSGTHFNLTLSRSRAWVESFCKTQRLVYAFRDWAGFLDVWLEDDLLVEIVCNG
jgi:hypothetical protein